MKYLWILLLSLLTAACLLSCHPPAQPEPSAPAISEQPVEPPVQEIEPEPEPEPLTYDFTQPAPETPAVDNSYFADAAFIGDSRTDGFMLYSGIGCGKNLTSNGLSIFQLTTKKALKINGQKHTPLEVLGMEEYGKVYLCLGINELGVYDDEGFYQSYLSAIDAIRKLQPNAVVYIQGLIPMNEAEVAAAHGREYLKNDRLRLYNDLMRQAAQEKEVVFLDLYTAFADETGSLPAGASRDGVHLNRDYCKLWLAYLQTHTVDPALLGLSGPVIEVPEPEPVPVVPEPAPVVPEPVPVVPEPAPVIPEPVPVVPEPVPVVPEPAPVVPEPAPVVPEPVPVVPEPAPVIPEPAPVVPEPAPVIPEPAPVVPEPAPVVPEPAPVVPEPAPVIPEPAPVVPDPIPAEEGAAQIISE